MRKSTRNLALAAALAGGLAAAPALYAHESDGSSGSMMGPGMMGQGGMMGMMNMMGQMGRMMDHCGRMMEGMADDQGTGRPNEQWRREAPATPEADE